MVLKKLVGFLNADLTGLNQFEFCKMFLDVLVLLYGRAMTEKALEEYCSDTPRDRAALEKLQEKSKDVLSKYLLKSKLNEISLIGQSVEMYLIFEKDGKIIRQTSSSMFAHMLDKNDETVKAGIALARLIQKESKNKIKVKKEKAVSPEEHLKARGYERALIFTRFFIPDAESILHGLYSTIQIRRVFCCQSCGKYETTTGLKKERLCKSCLTKKRVSDFRKKNKKFIGLQENYKRQGVNKSISTIREEEGKRAAKRAKVV